LRHHPAAGRVPASGSQNLLPAFAGMAGSKEPEHIHNVNQQQAR
jgi:hypothetical protein